jgi:hypothetical protein
MCSAGSQPLLWQNVSMYFRMPPCRFGRQTFVVAVGDLKIT